MLVGIGIVAYLFAQVNRKTSIIEALQHTRWEYIAACLLLLIPNIGLSFFKWRYLLRRKYPDISSHEALASLLFGYTLGLITPGRLGELGRGLFFPGRDRLLITGLNIFDKLANQVVVFTIGGMSVALVIWQQGLLNPPVALPLFAVALMVLIPFWLCLLRPAGLQGLLHWLIRRRGKPSRLSSLLQAAESLRQRDLFLLVAITVIWTLVIILQYHILVKAFAGVSFLQSLRAVSATLFIKTLLPITFGDLGIRESVAMTFYGIYNIPDVAVFNASLLIFLINFLLPALSGSYYVFQLRENGTEKLLQKET